MKIKSVPEISFVLLLPIFLLAIVFSASHATFLEVQNQTKEQRFVIDTSNNSQWHVQTVISIDDEVDGLDLALDSNNQPHIAMAASDLLYTHLVGSAWISQTVASSAFNPAIVVDDSNMPQIAYTRPGLHVIYAQLSGNNWVTDTVDNDYALGTSLILDSSGNPHLAYQDVRPTHLPWTRGIVYAYWTGSNWNTSTVDKGITGCEVDCEPVSLALDGFNSPQVAYRDKADNRIIHAVRDGISWITKTIDVDSFRPQLVLDSVDVPHVAYTHDGPEAKFGTYDGTSWITEVIDDEMVAWPSLVFDKFDEPHVAYCDVRPVPPGQGLKYAYLNGSDWVILQVDRVECNNVSIALDSLGNPHIVYYDVTNGALKYANWQSSTATAPIPVTGGTLDSVEDQTSYIFPTNLFTDTVVISHTSTFPGSVPAYNDLVGINHYFDVTAVFSSTNELAQPVSGHTYTITVSYTDDDLVQVDENTLAFYYWNGNEWEKEMSSVVHGSANQVIATSNHFSLWVVLGEPQWPIYLPVVLKE